jgi:hypothetical protein
MKKYISNAVISFFFFFTSSAMHDDMSSQRKIVEGLFESNNEKINWNIYLPSGIGSDETINILLSTVREKLTEILSKETKDIEKIDEIRQLLQLEASRFLKLKIISAQEFHKRLLYTLNNLLAKSEELRLPRNSTPPAGAIMSEQYQEIKAVIGQALAESSNINSLLFMDSCRAEFLPKLALLEGIPNNCHSIITGIVAEYENGNPPSILPPVEKLIVVSVEAPPQKLPPHPRLTLVGAERVNIASPQFVDASIETDTTSQDIDRLQGDLAAKQTEIYRLRKGIDIHNSSRQEVIAQQQATINQLESELAESRNGLHMARVNLAALGTNDEKYKRDLKFKDRLTGLLLRAQIGFDYRRPEVITGTTYRNTIIRTATGKGFRTHFRNKVLKSDAWKEANTLVTECPGLLARIGFSQKEAVQGYINTLHGKIQRLCNLLPFNELDEKTEIKVGRSLYRALETIEAYRNGEKDLPNDPIEILDHDGTIINIE